MDMPSIAASICHHCNMNSRKEFYSPLPLHLLLLLPPPSHIIITIVGAVVQVGWEMITYKIGTGFLFLQSSISSTLSWLLDVALSPAAYRTQ